MTTYQKDFNFEPSILDSDLNIDFTSPNCDFFSTDLMRASNQFLGSPRGLLSMKKMDSFGDDLINQDAAMMFNLVGGTDSMMKGWNSQQIELSETENDDFYLMRTFAETPFCKTQEMLEEVEMIPVETARDQRITKVKGIRLEQGMKILLRGFRKWLKALVKSMDINI